MRKFQHLVQTPPPENRHSRRLRERLSQALVKVYRPMADLWQITCAAFLRPFSRFVVCLSHGQAQTVQYCRVGRKNIRIMSVKSRSESDRKGTLWSVNSASVVVDWEPILVGETELPQLSARERVQAIPYQLSLCSPFDPDELSFSIRSVSESIDNSSKFAIAFGQNSELRHVLQSSMPKEIFPREVRSESLLWESAISKFVAKSDVSPDLNIFLVLFSNKVLVGLSPSDPSCLPRTYSLPSNLDEVPAGIQDAVLSYVSESEASRGVTAFQRILVTGDPDLLAHNSLFDEAALPAPLWLVEPAEICETVTGRTVRSNCKGSLHPTFYAHLCAATTKVAVLEPSARLQKPFIKNYVQGNLTKLLAYLVLFLLIAPLAMWIDGTRLQQELDIADERLQQMRPAVQRIAELKREFGQFGDRSQATSSVLQSLVQVLELKPETILFSSIDYLRGDRIILRGSSTSQSDPVQYVEKLQDGLSPGSVKLKHLSHKSHQDAERVEFLIEVGIADEES